MCPYKLGYFECDIIAPNLPNKVRRVAQVDDRKVLNGIFGRFRTVISRRMLNAGQSRPKEMNRMTRALAKHVQTGTALRML